MMRFLSARSRPTRRGGGSLPGRELLTEMGKYNEELVKAGVMLAGEGLPELEGGAGRFSGAERTVIDGPFAETKELIAGYWLIQVKSKEEAIEWVKRSPNPAGVEAEVEIRQVVEVGTSVPALTPELREQEDSLRTARRESVGRDMLRPTRANRSRRSPALARGSGPQRAIGLRG